MDELEISGKRYISSRRAAKEHGYHSDYIGQLIRGGKVVGQKVGRSWYVEETSLLAYFSEEKTTTIKQAPKEKKGVPVVLEEKTQEPVEEIIPTLEVEEVSEVLSEEKENDVEERVESVAVEEIKQVIFDAPPEEEYVVALKRTTPSERKSLLRYVEDDLSSSKKEPEILATILEERTAGYQDVKALKELTPKTSGVQWGRVVFLLAVVGIFTFGITFGISSSLAYSNTLKGSTNTAAVIYGL